MPTAGRKPRKTKPRRGAREWAAAAAPPHSLPQAHETAGATLSRTVAKDAERPPSPAVATAKPGS